MLSYEVPSDGSAAEAWSLIARPARWHEWAPQLGGAWGLGSPEVEVGARGAARLLGVVPVPARITAKEAGRSWSWQVGPVAFDHRVEARGAGCVVATDLRAAAPLEAVLRLSYGPVCGLLMKNLARVAARGATPGAGPAGA